jgi:peptidyl-prolyl cis-trans isomerase A (cyclophilin A)
MMLYDYPDCRLRTSVAGLKTRAAEGSRKEQFMACRPFPAIAGALIVTLALAAPLVAQTKKAPAKKTAGTYARFETSMGTFTVKLMPEKSPKTVANFVGLAEGTIDTITGGPGKSKPYYDGVAFHRVMPAFMIQAGDPRGDGTGGVGYRIADEFDPKFSFNKAGIMAMANTGRPNSAGSQFFITVAPYPSLNGKYTPFGQVVEGLEVVTAISKVKTTGSTGQPPNRPLQPVVMKKVTIERIQ